MNTLKPIKLKRRPWIERLLLMPYSFWKHYQVGRDSTSRRHRLSAAAHMAWLMIRPYWMRSRMMTPSGQYGGHMRLDEGPTMRSGTLRSGFGNGPQTTKPAIEPKGQGPVKPIPHGGRILPPDPFL